MNDNTHRRGLTRNVYAAVKALMIAEDIELGESPTALEWSNEPDLLSALESLQEDNLELTFEPGLLLDRERKGTVGVVVRGKSEGQFVPGLRFFIGKGDPPIIHRVLPEHQLRVVDPKRLANWLSKQEVDELHDSAMQLIAVVRREVSPELSVSLAPTTVLSNPAVRSEVIRFSVIARTISRVARFTHIGVESWTETEL